MDIFGKYAEAIMNFFFNSIFVAYSLIVIYDLYKKHFRIFSYFKCLSFEITKQTCQFIKDPKTGSGWTLEAHWILLKS